MLAAAVSRRSLGWRRVPGDRPAARPRARPPARRHRGRARSTSPSDVDPDRDHIRGPDDAPVTLVEYGDYECPYCGQAEDVIRELLDDVRRRPPLRLAPPAAERRPPERADGRRGRRGGGRAGQVLGDARQAARPPGRADGRATCAATPRSSGSTSIASGTSCAAASTRRAWPRTWPAPTRAAWPARRASSSTAGATRAPTTSTRSGGRCARRAAGLTCRRRRLLDPTVATLTAEMATAPLSPLAFCPPRANLQPPPLAHVRRLAAGPDPDPGRRPERRRQGDLELPAARHREPACVRPASRALSGRQRRHRPDRLQGSHRLAQDPANRFRIAASLKEVRAQKDVASVASPFGEGGRLTKDGRIGSPRSTTRRARTTSSPTT